MRNRGWTHQLAGAVFPGCLNALECKHGANWDLFKSLFDTFDVPFFVKPKVTELRQGTGVGHQARAVGNAIVTFALDKSVQLPQAFALEMISVAAKAKTFDSCTP